MKIGIDASCWCNQRGYGRFTRELLKAMINENSSHDYIFFIDAVTYSKCQFPDKAIIKSITVSNSALESASSSGRRSIIDMWKMGKAVSQEQLDIFFFPSVYSYFPILSSAKKIITIHDVIPEQFPKLVFPHWQLRLFWRLKVWTSLKQANQVLTVSNFSREGIIKYLNFDPNRISVVYEAADPVFQPIDKDDNHKLILSKYGLKNSDHYFLYVGGIGPHKNLNTLIIAFSNLIQKYKNSDLKLMIVGDFKNDSFWIDNKILEMIQNNNQTDQVIFPGYVQDSDITHLYSAAEALVMPSFSEGFGLPAVEAMACGIPVIGSNTTSLPEVVQNAGIFFNPYNADELTHCLERIYDDQKLKQNLGSKGLAIASTYTWQKSAQTVLTLFEELANHNGKGK